MFLLNRLFPDRFILALVVTAALGVLLPVPDVVAQGLDWLANILIVLLFFFHGTRLPREDIKAAVLHWRLHSTILGATFLLFPILALFLQLLFKTYLIEGLWRGVIFVSILPSTVQSSIAFTGIARGNVAAAVTAAAASNLAGVIITPLWVSVLLHSGVGAPSGGGLRIALLLLAPFIIGHLLRPWLKAWVSARIKWIKLNDRATILVSVFAAFVTATRAGTWHSLTGMMGVNLLLVCGLLLACAMLLIHVLIRLMGFNRADSIAIQFVGSKKSVATGLPMARILFAGSSLGLITLPLMLFHQIQLMVCATLARRWGAVSGADAGLLNLESIKN